MRTSVKCFGKYWLGHIHLTSSSRFECVSACKRQVTVWICQWPRQPACITAEQQATTVATLQCNWNGRWFMSNSIGSLSPPIRLAIIGYWHLAWCKPLKEARMFSTNIATFHRQIIHQLNRVNILLLAFESAQDETHLTFCLSSPERVEEWKRMAKINGTSKCSVNSRHCLAAANKSRW